MRSRVLLALALGLAGCSKEPSAPATAPAISVAPTPISPPTLSASETAPKVAAKPMREWRADDSVTARGKISTIMWPHMTRVPPGKKLGYFDVEGETPQIVVYWREAPACLHLIEVTGTVVELRGASRKPGQAESKVGDDYSERHIDVESARCVGE